VPLFVKFPEGGKCSAERSSFFGRLQMKKGRIEHTRPQIAERCRLFL
jgi:hypothetical protein